MTGLSIHTVVVARGRYRGVALGVDADGKPVYVSLGSSRAVDKARYALRDFGREINPHAEPQMIRGAAVKPRVKRMFACHDKARKVDWR